MPKSEKQKLKLYYLYKIMLEQTDDLHSLTMAQIIEELEEYGISAERKSIYRDFDILTNDMDLEIIKEQSGGSYRYHVGSKQFELAELKLLVDSVQSSKFITARKSNQLIKKITALGSRYEAQQLKRQVHVQGRIKTMNESIFYNVDEIHTAIEGNNQIEFLYLQWDENKNLIPRKKEGTDEIKHYKVSPWALTWDDENYYLVGFDQERRMIRHYRVDKMDKIRILNGQREGKGEFKDFDPAMYAKKNFGMFRGSEENVHIEFPGNMIGVFIDRFGKEIPIHRTKKEGIYQTTVKVFASEQFLGWIFALGPKVVITAPESVVDAYKKMLKETMEIFF